MSRRITPTSIRLEPELLEEIKARAQAKGESISTWMRQKLIDALGNEPLDEFGQPLGSASDRRDEAFGCTHPADQIRTTSLMTSCLKCGTRLG